jgi:hypothetical protein
MSISTAAKKVSMVVAGAAFVTLGTIGTASKASAVILAADNFNSYSTGSLLGQSAGGSGFAGNWSSLGLVANLDVYSDGTVGSQGVARQSNAGNSLNFASPINLNNSGQLFIKMTYTNTDSSPHESSRMDVNLNNANGGNRVAFGGFNGELALMLEQNLHTGGGNLTASAGAAGPGTYDLVALLDQQFGQIALWVNPDANDFYNPLTGATSANAVTSWNVPTGGLTNFVSYSLIRNLEDKVKFDNVAFATLSTDVGVAAATVPEPSTLLGIGAVLGLGSFLKRKSSDITKKA